MRRHLRRQLPWFAILSAAVLSIAPLATSQCAAKEAEPKLADELRPLIDQHHGQVALAIKNLRTGESFTYNGDSPMPTASVIKLPIMITVYQAIEDGKLSLDDMIELKKGNMVRGSGFLTGHMSPGAKLSLRDFIRLMISISDNTATNVVIDQIGLAATNERMRALGVRQTRLNSKIFRPDTVIDKDRYDNFFVGSTTAREMIGLVERLYRHQLVSEKASRQMLEHLYACEGRIKAPRFLPPGTRVAHKTGSVDECRNDTGVIDSPAGPIAYCILTNKNEDHGWGEDNEGDLFCSKVGRAVYRYFNDQPGAVDFVHTLQKGAKGKWVAALQRTLNARSEPAPKLEISGTFGSKTEAALKHIQSTNDLPATGVVDRDTWKALSPVAFTDEPVREPDVINSADLSKDPPDSLDGPPFVSCKAWAIADGETGELLTGFHEDVRRDPASTTKMMTALLVASLAEKDPSVLDQVVTFSQRADNTRGSTSNLNAGEQLTVRELLYGLLLPSGNDASVALAETFGKRLSPKADNAYDGFVTAMNRRAKQLDMSSTHFVNPHGLSVKEHKTTARDLALLGAAVFKQPELRRRVGTARHGATVDSAAGYQRNMLWENTNQLLKIEGYDGIKTGTTPDAGACLVSTAKRNGRRLIVVVLARAGQPMPLRRLAESVPLGLEPP